MCQIPNDTSCASAEITKMNLRIQISNFRKCKDNLNNYYENLITWKWIILLWCRFFYSLQIGCYIIVKIWNKLKDKMYEKKWEPKSLGSNLDRSLWCKNVGVRYIKIKIKNFAYVHQEISSFNDEKKVSSVFLTPSAYSTLFSSSYRLQIPTYFKYSIFLVQDII